MDQRQILLNALQKLGNGSPFLWLIFILTVTPPMFNGMHSMAYIFVADVPSHWCSIPDLKAASWTDEQIRNISSATSCTKYNYNYTLFAKMGFDRSWMYKRENKLPDTSQCSEWTFANDTQRSSIVQDWNLVCNKAAARTNTQVALSFGKLLGSAFFGIFADKYGRKPSYVIGVFLLIISGPTSAFVPWYWGYMLMRFFTGVSHAAIQSPSSTTLTEVASEKHRPWMGVACNIGYPVGTLTIVVIAYFFHDWRQIQLASTLPALFLLICVWLMPESPRWLISQNRYEEAKKLIEKSHGPINYDGLKLSEPVKERCENVHMSKSPTIHEKDHGFSHTLDNLKNLFSHYELRKRVMIAYFCWMTASLSYYALALNAANFSANRYVYTLIMGITEIPAYLVPSPIMMIMGRRQAGVLLYFIAAICLLSILIIPVAKTTLIIVVALTGRFALSSVYGVIILYTSELFPTVLRNTAVGTSGAMAHVGSVTAPYVADLLGAVAWWGPSTLCGILALVSGLLCLVLPETRGRALADTIEEEISGKRGTVSLRNCCKF